MVIGSIIEHNIMNPYKTISNDSNIVHKICITFYVTYFEFKCVVMIVLYKNCVF